MQNLKCFRWSVWNDLVRQNGHQQVSSFHQTTKINYKTRERDLEVSAPSKSIQTFVDCWSPQSLSKSFWRLLKYRRNFWQNGGCWMRLLYFRSFGIRLCVMHSKRHSERNQGSGGVNNFASLSSTWTISFDIVYS